MTGGSEQLKYVLPEEMIVEILYWIPVKSLLRFRSVCKSWLSIIADPKFIKTHAYCSQIMADKRGLPLMITKKEGFGGPLFAAIESKYYLHVLSNIKSNIEVIGSCNGIICLVEKYIRCCGCCLWNPFTMQSKKLPSFPENDQKALEDKNQAELAFGFDSIGNDYKVIRFPTNTTSTVPVLQLYSTNTDFWKEIHVRDASASRVLSRPELKFGPVINGVLYIMGHDMRQLVSFDLHYEVFKVVPFPSFKVVRSDVFDFEGSVAVVFRSVEKSSEISLWTLDNICGEVFWTEKFIVHDDTLWTCCYLGTGLFFGEKGARGGTKILYDNKKKEFQTFPRLAKQPEVVLKYTETFASLEGFKPSALPISTFYSKESML